jgi:hypothetical protein
MIVIEFFEVTAAFINSTHSKIFEERHAFFVVFTNLPINQFGAIISAIQHRLSERH